MLATNIRCMPSIATPIGKRERTRARLQECALVLFETEGFDDTTVAQIAGAAGVSEMTFYRHFATKEAVVLEDPYDPVIAEAIAAQPHSLQPLTRAVRGVASAWSALPEPEGELVRRRIRIAAGTPSLGAATWRNNAETERRIGDQLIVDGTAPLRARVVGAAVLAALVAGLFEWARHDDGRLSDVISVTLDTLDPADG